MKIGKEKYNHMKIYLRSNPLRSNERKSFLSYRSIKETGQLGMGGSQTNPRTMFNGDLIQELRDCYK